MNGASHRSWFMEVERGLKEETTTPGADIDPQRPFKELG